MLQPGGSLHYYTPKVLKQAPLIVKQVVLFRFEAGDIKVYTSDYFICQLFAKSLYPDK